eukprot:404296-Pyramimonas_sp.AAC.1
MAEAKAAAAEAKAAAAEADRAAAQREAEAAHRRVRHRVYSHDGPIRRWKRRYILTMDQSDAGNPGIYWGDDCTLAVIGTGGPVK